MVYGKPHIRVWYQEDLELIERLGKSGTDCILSEDSAFRDVFSGLFDELE